MRCHCLVRVVLAALTLTITATMLAQQERGSPADQKACSEQAAKVWERWMEQNREQHWDDSGNPGSFRSHYDPQSHICYMGAFRNIYKPSPKQVFHWREVLDAFEGTRFAEILTSHDDKISDIDTCEIEKVPCNSLSEFEQQVAKKYGIKF
jgi:hypothetical protein